MANVARIGIGTRTLARVAGMAARSWTLGRWVNTASHLAAKVAPAKEGRALKLAAQRAGVKNYTALRLSYAGQLNHTPELDGHTIGATYIGFGFHFSLFSAFLFPDILNKAAANPGTFYVAEVAQSAAITAGITAFMITGHMAATARQAYKTQNLTEYVEKIWDTAIKASLWKKIKFYGSFPKMLWTEFPGIVKKGATFTIDGESPINVSAAGPRFWDGNVAKVFWPISILLGAGAIWASGNTDNGLAFINWVADKTNTTWYQLATRTSIALAFISTIGKHFSGAGANKAYVVDQETGNTQKVTFEHKFDMENMKKKIEKGEE